MSIEFEVAMAYLRHCLGTSLEGLKETPVPPEPNCGIKKVLG
jgi:hypothetical protein